MNLRIFSSLMVIVAFLMLTSNVQAKDLSKSSDLYDYTSGKAPNRRYYISSIYGYASNPTDNSNTKSGEYNAAIDSSKRLNYFGVAIGKHWNDLRLELEVTHSKTKLISSTTQNFSYFYSLPPRKIDFKTTNILLNAYYDMPINAFFVPYIGLGLGVTISKALPIHARTITTLDNEQTTIASNKTEEYRRNGDSYQFSIGTNVYLNEQASIGVSYRALATAGKTSFEGLRSIFMTTLTYDF